MKILYLPIGSALLGVLLAALACSFTPRTFMLPVPETATPGQPSRPNTILPTVAPDLPAPPAPATTRSPATQSARIQPSASARRPATPTALPSPAAATQPPAAARPPATPRPIASPPTADPHLVVIREEDIGRAITAGAGEEQGLSAQGLQVRFRDGVMTLSADELSFGPVQIKQLAMTGRLVAQNGQLQYESETISPRGLVTGLLPALINQALAQYATQWYVEEVQVRDGRLILRIR